MPFLFSKAKLLLKKKRYQESLLTKTDDQLDTLEKLVWLQLSNFSPFITRGGSGGHRPSQAVIFFSKQLY